MPVKELRATVLQDEVGTENLTPRQQAFVREFLVSLNATEAAIRAGYSPRSAHVTASRLMKAKSIEDAIANGKKEAAARATVTIDMVIEQLRKIAFADIRKAFRADGSLKPIVEMDEETASAIASIESHFNLKQPHAQVTKIRLVDQISALYKLGLHLGTFGPAKAPLTAAPVEGMRLRADKLEQVRAEVIELFNDCLKQELL